MEMQIRKAAERGGANHGWLDTKHTFSFAEYYDPRFMGFRALRVINEDKVAPDRGFGRHPHADMEILTYVLSGELAHKDSMGNGSTIVPGDVQRMSAGTGVRHSEFNHESAGVTHFLQIWIEPSVRGIAPGYEQKHFESAKKRGRLRLIASPDGREGSVTIHQDAFVYAALIDGAERVVHNLAAGRRVYVHVARGEISVNAERLAAGDALKASGIAQIVLENGRQAEVLLFDLA